MRRKLLSKLDSFRNYDEMIIKKKNYIFFYIKIKRKEKIYFLGVIIYLFLVAMTIIRCRRKFFFIWVFLNCFSVNRILMYFLSYFFNQENYFNIISIIIFIDTIFIKSFYKQKTHVNLHLMMVITTRNKFIITPKK